MTDLERTEEALHESHGRFRAFFEHGPDGIVILDPPTARIIEFNDRACRQLGYSREEFAALSVPDFEALETRDETRARIDKILREGHDDFFTQHRTKDGELRDVHVTVRVIEVGDRDAYHCVFRDITERTRAEEELRQSEARFRALVESAPEAIVLLDLESGVFVDFNQKACHLFGLRPEEMRTKRPADMSPPAQPDGRSSEAAAAEVIQRAIEGESPRFEWTHRNASGEDIPCEVDLTRLPSTERLLIRGSIVDITDRKRAEEEKTKLQEQLAQAQKMESVGRLAGGVAHDFNNMLSVILGHTELAVDQVAPSNSIHAHLEEIHTAATRSADLTRQLLTFARKQTVVPEVLDLNETVEGTLKMMRRLIGENIELVWKPGINLWPVRVDSSQIDQILANLCVNARDAIPDVGSIVIETDNDVVDEAYCADRPGFAPGEYVLLSVRDDGCGMDPATLALIFEPFFTTKGVGEGTGLGLATVYGAVKQNQGFIDVDSEPGKGTVFSIYLPRHAGRVAAAESDGRGQLPTGGTETVLVVEDEPAILRLVTTVLEGQGYTVLAADTPGEAVVLAEEHAGDIDLLMTDVVMPEMNGRDLALKVCAIHPDIELVFMSGYAADLVAHHGILEHGTHFIQKPFTRLILANKVRDVLDARSPLAASH